MNHLTRFLTVITCFAFVANGCDILSDKESGNEDDFEYAEIRISKDIIVFEEGNVANNSFTVTSNVGWYTECDNPSLEFSPESGDKGTAEIRISDIGEGESGTIAIISLKRSPGDPVVREEVYVSRESDKPVPWPEMPETVKANSDYKYVTHYATTVRTGQYVRNYSACYDTERHNPVWVAYPMHSCYQEGGWARTEPDPWRPDPDFESHEQSIIYGSDWNDWPWGGASSATDRYQYWSPLDNGPFFSRGHLLRSADRGGHNTTLNIQTFYPTNIVPERLLYPDIHSRLEDLLSDSWTCRDTIYVVAGCYYEDDGYYVYDACSYDTHSSLSKRCDLPSAIYKVYLRTKRGNTGKRISDCSADELKAIGFWMPQDLANQGSISGGNIRDFACSVDEIEEKTGGEFRFFPEVPASVTSSYNPSDWGI